ncbi:MAG: hypothetical protein K2Y30_11590 [Flavobacteriaceae bacterium]|jgi:uncharacterized membrane protein YidH (DUF202 family)|nr:hypothetical protein [Flavobacteriaceae bacterium]
MNLIFAKLFEDYIKKNDPAEFKITVYISIFYFFLMFNIFLPVKTFIDKNIASNQIHYEKNFLNFFVFGILVVIIFIVYKVYIKNKHIYELTKKYKNKRLNKFTLYSIVALAPAIMLLLASTITVYMNGGEILGHEIKGLLE